MKREAAGIGMIGGGTVGGGVAALLDQHAALYAARAGRPLELRRVLVRDPSRVREGIDPDRVTADTEALFGDPEIGIVVEVAGGSGPVGDLVRRALESGRHVVTANKALLAAEGPELFALARARGVSIAFEASCGGGIPLLTALQFGLMANRVTGLYGILNGTCNDILTAMTREGTPYEEALARAQALGYAEADPTLDVSGRDAAEKLAIIASLAYGRRVDPDRVVCRGIDRLALEDIRFGAELGYDVKLLAIAEEAGGRLGLRTEPCFIDVDQPLAQVHGSFNALSVYGEAVGHTLYFGRGAGRMPTASAVVSDLMNVAAGWYPHAFASMGIWPEPGDPPVHVDEDLESRFYLRISALDVPGVMAEVSRRLGEAAISLSAIRQHESNEGEFVPVVITTHRAKLSALTGAIKAIASLDCIDGEPVWIRIVDLPEG